MITRRQLLVSGAALGLTLPVLAKANENAMPKELRDAIERQTFSPVLGNPKGDITLTEFFDYHCPICREIPPLLKQLISEDKGLRIVLREWPVLRPESEAVARISLASLKQSKYWQFHYGMFTGNTPPSERAALQLAEQIGLDMTRLKRDMQGQDVTDHINQSLDLGDHMGLTGTPTFIAGNDGRFGRQSVQELQALIKSARTELS